MHILFVALLIAALPSAEAQPLERYPATNLAYLTEAGFKATAENQLVAVEGRILRIAMGAQGKPMYELALTQSANRNVWVANLMFDKDAQLPIGAVVRAFGYLQRIKDDDKWTKAVTSDDHHILGFCFLNTVTQMAIYLPPGIKQCEAWQDGKTPEQIAR